MKNWTTRTCSVAMYLSQISHISISFQDSTPRTHNLNPSRLQSFLDPQKSRQRFMKHFVAPISPLAKSYLHFLQNTKCFISTLTPVRVRHLTGHIRRTWWWRRRGSAPTSRRASSCPRARSTSPGSPSTTRTARWSSAAGRTMGSR